MPTAPVRRHPHLWFAATLLLLCAAVLYFLLPARSLPHFFPGYAPGDGTHLIGDTMVCAFLSLGCFIAGMATTAADESDRRRRADRAPGRIRTVPPPRDGRGPEA